MMKKRLGIFFLCPVLALFLLQGCIVATNKTVILPEIAALFKGTYTIDPSMSEHIPKSVAVLPFRDLSGSREGSATVRKGFYNHFSSLTFKDMELYRIDSLLEKSGLADIAALYRISPGELGSLLGVDAVILGDISDFDKIFAVMYSQVSVGAEIRMYDTKTGHLLWSGKHIARIHEGGVSVSPVGIIATVIATSLNVRDIQLLRACDDLFRDMVKTIPMPTLAEASKPPTIAMLTQDTKGLPKKAGDEIRVVIQGTPKMRAGFAIGDYRKNVEMQEIEPGGYLGVYKVLPGDNISGAMVTGYLVDDAGNRAQWVDAAGSVTLDTTPPDSPQNLKTVGRDGCVILDWEGEAACDLAGYRLYRSETPLTGFVEITRTELTRYTDRGLSNGRTYYFQVSAFDLAGNESRRTNTVTGLPLAPGPTMVSGSIEHDTVWHSGAGPYVVEKEVVVRDKACLVIEPGTDIRSAGPGIVIEGRLQAQGDGEHTILFDAQESKTWEGLKFVNVKESTLKHVRIRNARTGVLCDSSSPRIEASEFVENRVALRVTGSFSRPEFVGNTVQKQRETAIIVETGARPVLTDNRICDNDREGILVLSASPVITRNTVSRNGGTGVALKASSARIAENAISGNRPFEISEDTAGEPVNAKDNWWGTARGPDILKKIQGRIHIETVLSAPYPEGNKIILPVLSSALQGVVTKDGLLTLSNSPYRVVKDVVVDAGAALHVQPGVEILYERNTSLILADGGIIAKGTPEHPISFSAAAATPTPGFYTNAVRFTVKTGVNSAFSHCVVRFATTAFDMYAGGPEISHCVISGTTQSGIFCRNDATPRILYNTFKANAGEGAVKCVGMSNPSVHHNNFIDNAVAIQAFSSIRIDARENWWGTAPPDTGLIWGDLERNINIKPWLEGPEEKAFYKD
jgi:parallel beta-helix repeat protein